MIHFNWLGDIIRYNMSLVPRINDCILVGNKTFRVIDIVWDLDSLRQNIMKVYITLNLL